MELAIALVLNSIPALYVVEHIMGSEIKQCNIKRHHWVESLLLR